MKTMDYFDRCFVINLPARGDRRRAMQAELDRVGMPFQPGKVEIFPGIRPDDAGPFPSLGARGCFESHLAILRTAKAEGLRNVLIMEDDLTIDPLFGENSERLIAELQTADWGFAFFGHVLDAEPTGPDVRLSAYPGPIMTAHFYAINGAILDRLLAFFDALLQRPPGHPDGSPMHVDGAYSTFRKQNPDVLTLVALPSLGWQRSSRSDIYPNRWYDRWPVFRELAGLARALKTRLRGR